jgi:hypothetical protein
MNRTDAETLLAALSGERVVFPYFRDRYALQLLAYAACEGRRPFELRRGRFRPLLQKPAIRSVLHERGGRGVDWRLLDTWFPRGTEPYELTFALWGHEVEDPRYQTTRAGFNLVLQVNFPRSHDRAYRRYVAPRSGHPFVLPWHPVRTRGLQTMAWARIDLDPAGGEALIEEVQSDWIRDAEAAGAAALANLAEGHFETPAWLGDVGGDAADLHRYVEHVLRPHRRLWAEATLAASLWLLRERLGVRRIYMHTPESGAALKRIGGVPPPRSVYDRLPRAFCFGRGDAAPRFLPAREIRRIAPLRPEFWRLDL